MVIPSIEIKWIDEIEFQNLNICIKQNIWVVDETLEDFGTYSYESS